MTKEVGKIEILMYDSGYVEVHSNFATPDMVREVLSLAQKAMRQSSVMGGFEIGKTQSDIGSKVRGDRKDHRGHNGFPKLMR